MFIMTWNWLTLSLSEADDSIDGDINEGKDDRGGDDVVNEGEEDDDDHRGGAAPWCCEEPEVPEENQVCPLIYFSERSVSSSYCLSIPKLWSLVF